jgi:hypothetical protein
MREPDLRNRPAGATGKVPQAWHLLLYVRHTAAQRACAFMVAVVPIGEASKCECVGNMEFDLLEGRLCARGAGQDLVAGFLVAPDGLAEVRNGAVEFFT